MKEYSEEWKKNLNITVLYVNIDNDKIQCEVLLPFIRHNMIFELTSDHNMLKIFLNL